MTHKHRIYSIATITLDDLAAAADELRGTVMLSGDDNGRFRCLVTMDADDCEAGVNNFMAFEESLTLRDVDWRLESRVE